MAKKRFNVQLAAAVAVTAIVIVGGGYIGQRYVKSRYHPAEYKNQGREFMLKGDYANAYASFYRAEGTGRLTTDMEFLGWMYETTLRRTSFSDSALKEARGLVEQMLATRPDDVPTILRKLKFDLDLIDVSGVENLTADNAKHMNELATKALAADPTNDVAIRAQAVSESLPIFKQDTAQTSGDMEGVVTVLRNMLDKYPDNPDITLLYCIGIARDRETLVREHSIDASPTDPRAKAMADDLSSRVEGLIKLASDESKPAEFRAIAYERAARIDQITGSAGFVTDNAAAMKLFDRRAKSLATAAALVPKTSEQYLAMRIEYAGSLVQQEKIADAESSLRQTIDAAPLTWQPRLFLAETLSDHSRPADALELVKADLQPSYDLVGLPGAQFFEDRRTVPLRRAFYRLQNLSNIKAEDRPAEIALAQADYDLALADGKISENEPYALQVKAGMQEIKLDRTGAVQTLTRALESTPNERLKLRLEQQLVTLNLGLNQPGAASAMLETMIHNPSLTPQAQLNSVIQLIDLRIRNGATEQARVLLEQAKKSLPDNPALMVLDIKLMTDPQQQKAALAKVPEDTPQVRSVKMRFAMEIGADDIVNRLAAQLLKDEPGSLETSEIYGDYLRRHDKRDQAVQVFQTALKLHPDDKTLPLLIKDTQAVNSTQRSDVITQMLSKDPYKKALFEADQFRTQNKLEDYAKKLVEAEPLDAAKDGVATERLALYYMMIGDSAKASEKLDQLSTMNRDPAQLRVLRIRLELATSKSADAAAHADALTSDLPNFAAGWVMKGMAFEQTNQPSQAIDAFETALTNQPGNLEALHGLIDAADRAGRRDVLKRYIDEGLRVTNGADDYFVDWSLRYDQTFGDPTTTITPRLKRRDLAPDNADQWLLLAQSYMASAQYKDKAGDSAAAADYRAKALAVFQEASKKFPKSYGFTLEAADLLTKAGDNDNALKMVEAIASTPDLSSDTSSMIARFYNEHAKPDLAAQVLQKQVDTGKATDTTRLQLASLQASAGNNDDALKTLAPVADSPVVREARINIYMGTKRFAEAQKIADDALAKERSVPNLLLDAVVLASQKHTPEALKLTDEAVAADSENAAARFTRARILLTEKPLRNNDIIADLEIVKKNQPSNKDGRLLLVNRLSAVGRVSESTQELETLLQDFPGDSDIATKLIQNFASETPPRYARIDQLISDLKKQGGDKDPQILLLESAVAMQRGNKDVAVSAVRAAVKYAQPGQLDRALLGTLLRAGANADAITESDRIQKNNAALYWTYLTRGIAQHHLKHEDEAAKEFDRAIGLASAMKESAAAVLDVTSDYSEEYGAEAASDWAKSKLPDEPATQELQMHLLTLGGKTDKAIEVGNQIMPKLASLPKAAQIQILGALGNAYLTASPPRADDAQTMFARLNEIEPDNMMTLNNLAYAMTLSNGGQAPQEAVDIAKRAYDLAEANAGGNAAITDTYGWTLYRAGKIDDGLAMLRQAQEEGSLPESDYHIGEVCIVQNQKDAAIQSLQAAQSKVNAAKLNGQPIDPTLSVHIEDALKRAQALVATP